MRALDAVCIMRACTPASCAAEAEDDARAVTKGDLDALLGGADLIGGIHILKVNNLDHTVPGAEATSAEAVESNREEMLTIADLLL